MHRILCNNQVPVTYPNLKQNFVILTSFYPYIRTFPSTSQLLNNNSTTTRSSKTSCSKITTSAFLGSITEQHTRFINELSRSKRERNSETWKIVNIYFD